jgi:hypothetical protein
MIAAEMEAGGALDARVAKKVMGRHVMSVAGGRWTEGYAPSERGGVAWFVMEDATRPREELPYYSLEVADAWEVVERLREFGCAVFVGGRPDAWEVEIISEGGLSNKVDDQPTAPLAIVRAALAAVEGP